MSGGFFRGTSAEQDTRFSNKQAKLLKSQKFAPELEHLVDMSKVKMDVIRPWIATRVTELLGFEDEVLINFIYGLLDGKEVNGKQIQISLTGFMEKNTGKFMKELWSLLLSAQNNASGVPQQFLDAKEEETRKKKADVDRIASEIQKKKDKESRERDQERRKMDGDVEMKPAEAELEPSSRQLSRVSSENPDDERDAGRRNDVRRRKRASGSPHSADRSLSSPQRSRSRSVSRSLSNSRSYPKHRSRSVSRSPEPRHRSISSDRMKRSPRRRSLTPQPRHSPRVSLSPPRWKSYRRRSRSRSPRRSRSPVRRRLRSPYRRRSPSPVRRRSPSPRRRSPSPARRSSPARRRRSPSPTRRGRSRSPVRRRSPSPVRRRSPPPFRRRSPSPFRRRSPSPLRRRRQRSPTPRRRSPSPMQRRPPPSSRRRSSTPSRGRSASPYGSSSPSSARCGSPAPIRRKSSKEHRRSPLESPHEGDRLQERLSPVKRQSSSMRSLQRDPRNQKELQNKVSVLPSSPERSPSVSESPTKTRKRAANDYGSPYKSPLRQVRERVTHNGSGSPQRKAGEFKSHQTSPETSKENEDDNQAREDDNGSSRSLHRRSLHSPNVSKGKNSPLKYLSPENKNENSFGREVRPGTPDQQSSPISDERGHFRQNEVRDNYQSRKTETVATPVEKVDHNNQHFNSDSEGKDNHRSKRKEKRKHRRSERQEVTSDEDYSSESEIEDRKEAKRRRKEEKRLRKEEKRRRREERHRKREERRAEKLKLKNQDDSNASDGGHVSKREPHSSDDEETVSDQKKLEIELRKKALESLKAKKGINH
ncbi:hypothetical protein SLE2022_282870 [Rubroshorea leprosula]